MGSKTDENNSELVKVVSFITPFTQSQTVEGKGGGEGKRKGGKEGRKKKEEKRKERYISPGRQASDSLMPPLFLKNMSKFGVNVRTP